MLAFILASLIVSPGDPLTLTAPSQVTADCAVMAPMREDSINVHVWLVGPVWSWWGPFAGSFKKRTSRGGKVTFNAPGRPGKYFVLSYPSNSVGASVCPIRKDTVNVIIPPITDLEVFEKAKDAEP